MAFLTPVMVVPNIAAPGYALSNVPGDLPYGNTAIPYINSSNYVVQLTGAGNLVPSGTLTFMGNAGNTGGCGLNGAFTLASATAQAPTIPGSVPFNPECLPINLNANSPDVVTPQTITSIVYGGDQYFAPVTATTTANGSAITFNMLRNPSVAISASPSTVTVTNGTGSTTLSITSVLGYGGVSTNANDPLMVATSDPGLNNYALPLAFACQGLPAYATCTFTGGNYRDGNGVAHPDEVNVNTDPSVPVSITMTIHTNVSTGATASVNSHPAPYEFAAMLGVGLFGLLFGGKSGRKKWAMMMLCLMMLAGALAGLTACSTTNLTPPSVTTTPSGSYKNVIVTAQQVGSQVYPVAGNQVTVYGNENQMSLPFSMNVTVQ